MLAAGDMNTHLVEPEGDQREEDMAATMTMEGLEDMLGQFLLQRRPWCWDGRTWSMLQKGREVRSRTDYILGTDRCLFGNVSFRDPRHNSYHYIGLGCLHSASLTEHTRYLGGRKKLFMQPSTEPTREDIVFADLWRSVPKPRAQEAQKNEWTSAETLRLVNERVSAR